MIPFPDHPGRLVTCHKPCLRGNQLHLSRCTFISGFTELYQWTCNGDIIAICIHLAVLEIAMVVIFIHEIIIKMQHSKLTVLVQEKHLFAWENSASWFSCKTEILTSCLGSDQSVRRTFCWWDVNFPQYLTSLWRSWSVFLFPLLEFPTK